ncbi:DUF4249 domain-containing protein [Cytophagaceae bacterium DM2B3-1]|uniref:DUF4249 domain-containing protein n=1 Tax=Xanthocytophaga flava TaxID=3048013 RepID=A0ABT7CHS8_9BACT|nr:DUF4249 domain-containing protein [Xanthocytophaga flavus]MDJ1468404.1 DUF4249 domain-containing protein [Xanthocytophaga flavus]MDJ1493290.1 DUF4249 domain-containing protein [Xanthocytophaga flavus]
MKYISLFIIGLLTTCLLSSCEDVIQIDVAPAESQLVIDAFISNTSKAQTIRLTKTVPYFEEGDAPTISGAEIVLKNETTGREFIFTDTQTNGQYTWTPARNDSIGKVGDVFLLTVRYDNNEYQASSHLNRTTKIDSITVKYEKESGDDKAGYYARFYGYDLAGQKDYYWIKSFKNNQYQTKLLTYATNAIGGTDDIEGTTDSLAFIEPISKAITDGDDPFQLGDKVRVEIWSITQETIEFFSQAEAQINNGGLFARPPENLRTNFTNKTDASKKPVGWFSTSVVSELEGMVEDK